MATWATRDRAEAAEGRVKELETEVSELTHLLTQILMNAEYPKMEAEGLAAAKLGLQWSENDDRYVRAARK